LPERRGEEVVGGARACAATSANNEDDDEHDDNDVNGGVRTEMGFPVVGGRVGVDGRCWAWRRSGGWGWGSGGRRRRTSCSRRWFAKLPEEMRLVIYGYVLGGRRLHVLQSYRRFGYVECVQQQTSGVTKAVEAEEEKACTDHLRCLQSQMDVTESEPHLTLVSRLTLERSGGVERLKVRPRLLEGCRGTCAWEMLAIAKTCRLA